MVGFSDGGTLINDRRNDIHAVRVEMWVWSGGMDNVSHVKWATMPAIIKVNDPLETEREEYNADRTVVGFAELKKRVMLGLSRGR